MNTNRIAALLVCLVTANASSAIDRGGAAPVIVAAPGGRLQFKLITDEPRLKFTVTTRDGVVIEPSSLVFTIDGADLTDGATIGAVETYKLDEKYPWRGAHSEAINKCNGAKIAITSKSGVACTLDVRSFDDAVAFRFVSPGESERLRVPEEATVFTLPAGSTLWHHDLSGHYEATHTRTKIDDLQKGTWVAPPATFKLPGGGYGSITEACLVNYSGMAMQGDGERGLVLQLADKHPLSGPFKLRYGTAQWADYVARLTKPAPVKGEITTPWRVVLASPDLNGLVNSDAVWSLNPPPDAKIFPQGPYTEWCKPGGAVWKYLDGGLSASGQRVEPTTAPAGAGAEAGGRGTATRPGGGAATRPGGGGGGGRGNAAATLAEQKEFCRLAGELGFRYDVIEGVWGGLSPEQLRELADYGKARGVGIVLWVHSNRLHDPEARQALFKRVSDAGAAGLKIDFFDNEAKEVVDLYEAILREAAAYHLVLDFHGANKPTGLERTWPNSVTYEAVRGMESRNVPDKAVHETTLPFTRCLAGPAEYTVLHLGARRGNTTWAHQIATAAILSAPMETYSGNPRSLLDNPAADVIKSIPSVWDQTIVLPPSEIGELAVFARRSGTMWMLAVANSSAAKTITVPLSFLGDGEYTARYVRDVPDNAAAVKMEDGKAKRGDTLTLDLPVGGGFVGRFTK